MLYSVVMATKRKKDHPLHKTWEGMRQRCLNPKSPSFERYGGRGITICPEWVTDFEQFCEDMGPRPKSCTLDRIDNNKGYSPDNCRWATPIMQANNTTRNVYVTYNNQTLTVIEWTRLLGLKETTLRVRLERGWSLERALFKSPEIKQYEVAGISKTLCEWSEFTGIHKDTLRYRFKHNWPDTEVFRGC